MSRNNRKWDGGHVSYLQKKSEKVEQQIPYVHKHSERGKPISYVQKKGGKISYLQKKSEREDKYHMSRKKSEKGGNNSICP
jgi:hypothetical protein